MGKLVPSGEADVNAGREGCSQDASGEGHADDDSPHGGLGCDVSVDLSDSVDTALMVLVLKVERLVRMWP